MSNRHSSATDDAYVSHAAFAEQLIRENITNGKAEWVLGFVRVALQEARGLGFREGNDLPADSKNPHLIESGRKSAPADTVSAPAEAERDALIRTLLTIPHGNDDGHVDTVMEYRETMPSFVDAAEIADALLAAGYRRG